MLKSHAGCRSSSHCSYVHPRAWWMWGLCTHVCTQLIIMSNTADYKSECQTGVLFIFCWQCKKMPPALPFPSTWEKWHDCLHAFVSDSTNSNPAAVSSGGRRGPTVPFLTGTQKRCFSLTRMRCPGLFLLPTSSKVLLQEQPASLPGAGAHYFLSHVGTTTSNSKQKLTYVLIGFFSVFSECEIYFWLLYL